MKRIALVMAAVAAFALVPATGAAAASSSPNTGCPAASSGWQGPYTFDTIFWTDVNRALAAGYTEDSLMALFGASSMTQLEQMAVTDMTQMDKNSDGRLCIKDNQSLVNLGYVYYDMIIDNIAASRG